MIVPVIPPELKHMSTSDTDKTQAEPEVDYGPALPPSFTPGKYSQDWLIRLPDK